MKIVPDFPDRFDTVDDAVAWVESYVYWYHHVHRHSSIGFVTPLERRTGVDIGILETRRKTYEKARTEHPERWSGRIRTWDRPKEVTLNPRKRKSYGQEKAA